MVLVFGGYVRGRWWGLESVRGLCGNLILISQELLFEAV